MGSERAHPRYAHEATVRFHVGQRTVDGRTRNVSRGGLCATLADPLTIGDDVDVELVLVFDDELHSDALRLPARIVWCTHLDDANQIGIVFRPLDARRAEQLGVFLSCLGEQRAEKTTAAASLDERFR
jgi:hypothetical protein